MTDLNPMTPAEPDTEEIAWLRTRIRDLWMTMPDPLTPIEVDHPADGRHNCMCFNAGWSAGYSQGHARGLRETLDAKDARIRELETQLEAVREVAKNPLVRAGYAAPLCDCILDLLSTPTDSEDDPDE